MNVTAAEKWRKDMEIILEGGEAARQLWRDTLIPLADNPDDPHDREYYEDLAEVLTVAHRMKDGEPFIPIEIGYDEFFIGSVVESVFVAWIKRLMAKGLHFGRALDRAIQITIEEDPNLDHIVYELGEGDGFTVAMWRAQLKDQGIDPLEAQEKAEGIVRMLRQQYFAKDEDWFDEWEKARCDAIHKELAAARAAAAST